MRESKYQAQLIDKLRDMFPGIIILKNDSRYIQGIPDLVLLYGDKWAMLEVKFSISAGMQPNQEYYVDLLNDLSFASFINPENEEEVLNALQHAFRFVRESRLS